MIIGVAGMFLILLAFFMNQIHKWKDNYLIYDSVNFIGAVLLITYSSLIRSYPFLILNSVWAAVSVRDIFLDIKAVKKPKTGIGHKRR